MRKKQVSSERQSDETAPQGFASICSVLAVGLFALTFVFENFVIPSSSMASTLLVGDHVLVERQTLAPPARWAPFLPYRDVHRGDIIVFYKPTEERSGDHPFLVKRVIGIPGDHIHLRKGVVYLDGVAQNEPEAAKPTSWNLTYLPSKPVNTPFCKAAGKPAGDSAIEEAPTLCAGNGWNATTGWIAPLPTRAPP